MPPVPFVLLSSQRSGSSWVIDSLASHRRIVAYDELFIAAGLMEALRARSSVAWGSTGQEPWHAYATRAEAAGRRPSVLAYLDGVYGGAAPGEAIGFKLMHSQVREHPATLAYLRRRRVRTVHLRRRNLLDRLLSMEAMRQSGVSKSNDDVPPTRLTVDPTDLVARLRRLARPVTAARTAVRLLGIPALEVDYEDLVAEPERFADVVGFLLPGDTGGALSSSLRKLVRLDHRQLIENYDEVAAALSGTRFESMLRP